MLKRIQKYLLINHPLLWNTRIVPVSCFLILAHIIFFFIGYQFGRLDFTETSRHFSNKDSDTVFFFGVVIAIFVVILWLVFYFKNNAFKSFYPKSNWALFKEWSILFVISLLLCTINLSYLKGYDFRVKSYYSEEEAKKRCETISDASLFYGVNYDAPRRKDSIVNDTNKVITLDYVKFNGRKYSLESVINKDNKNLPFTNAWQDSISKRKIKLWLVNGKTDSIKAILKDYFKLVREHKLVSNINEDKWFSIIYNPPAFENKKIVAKRESELFSSKFYDYEDSYAQPATVDYTPEAAVAENKIDTLNEYVKTVNNVKYRYYKYYVPAAELEYNYDKIATVYVNPSVDSELVLLCLYFAVCLSILLFSFKVTSGKNWLITLISLGVSNIILGILTIITSSEFIYVGGLILLFLALLIYFIAKVTAKTTKGISAIILNAILWLLPAFIPLVYSFIMIVLRRAYYTNYSYTQGYAEQDPNLTWMENHAQEMGWLNIAFIIIMLLILSFNIRKWKGIAEN
ncbi:MAG: hypothetical protein QM710_00710 [Flavobacterium sp.]